MSALGFQLNEVIPKILKEEQGYGEFQVYINLYKDATFTEKLRSTDYPLEISVQDLLFFEVKLDTDDNRLTVFAENCSVTPTRDKNDPRRYFLTKSGYV